MDEAGAESSARVELAYRLAFGRLPTDEEEQLVAEFLARQEKQIAADAATAGGEGYLHDGRARTIEEAILWHGGEAENSRNGFENLPALDRAALIAFLQSL